MTDTKSMQVMKHGAIDAAVAWVRDRPAAVLACVRGLHLVVWTVPPLTAFVPPRP